MKEAFKSAFKKIDAFLFGTPPVNAMNASDVKYIQEQVRMKTKFDVAAMDTRIVNGRKNVGLVILPATPADEVTKAEEVFIAAAKDRNIEIARDQVIRYVPGSQPSPSRLVSPKPKTW